MLQTTRIRSTITGIAVVGIASALVGAGCSSSSHAAVPSGSTTGSTSATSMPTSTTSQAPARLTGTRSIDITWSINPQVGVPCPTGLSGFCTSNRANGTDPTLGSVSLAEYLATPSQNSCSTGEVAGHFTMADSAESDMTYTGTGQFCWSSITGTFNLKLGKGTGQFAGATGTLVAKVTSSGDEWTGTLTFAG